MEWCPLADFAKEIKATFKGKEEEIKDDNYLLKYPFVPSNCFKFVLSKQSSVRKT